MRILLAGMIGVIGLGVGQRAGAERNHDIDRLDPALDAIVPHNAKLEILKADYSLFHVTARHPSKAVFVYRIGNALCCVEPLRVFQPKFRGSALGRTAQKNSQPFASAR